MVQRRRRKVRAEISDRLVNVLIVCAGTSTQPQLLCVGFAFGRRLKEYVRKGRSGKLSKGETPLREYLHKQNQELLSAHKRYNPRGTALQLKDSEEEKDAEPLAESKRLSFATRTALGRMLKFDALSSDAAAAPHNAPADIPQPAARPVRRNSPAKIHAATVSQSPPPALRRASSRADISLDSINAPAHTPAHIRTLAGAVVAATKRHSLERAVEEEAKARLLLSGVRTISCVGE